MGTQNGRRPHPKWKTTKMEDDQNGRQPKWKTTKMEDDLIDVWDFGWRVNQPGNSAIPRFRYFYLHICFHCLLSQCWILSHSLQGLIWVAFLWFGYFCHSPAKPKPRLGDSKLGE